MEINFNFKSQICTDRNQSERLLALGLKKETADMVYEPHYVNGVLKDYFEPKILEKKVLEYMLTDEAFKDYIPAWSLDRLWELMPKVVFSKPALHLTMCGDSVFYCTEDNNEAYEKPFSGQLNIYDNLINCIEWLIKEGYFNKEYLI